MNVLYLKELRERSGLSQTKLSKECGVSRQQIILIEHGGTHPSVKLAKKFGEIFGVDWWKFFDDV